MTREQEVLETRYNRLILDIFELSYHQAQERLAEISRVLGNPGTPVEETTQLLRYSKHLVDHCKSFLEADTTPPQVVTLDRTGTPVGLRNLDLDEN